MPNEQVKSRLQALTKNQLLCLAEKFNVKLKSSEKKNKEKIVEGILRKVPPNRLGELVANAEEMMGEKKAVGGWRTKRVTPAEDAAKAAFAPEDLLRELSEMRRILEAINERLPAKVPSFRDFARAVIEEYWRLGGGFVSIEELKEAVRARMLITPQVFDTWFNDLVWAAAGRLTVAESRTERGRCLHVLMKARTPEELMWGG
jgi:hypothetical protein